MLGRQIGHLILQDPQKGWQRVGEKMEKEREGGWSQFMGMRAFECDPTPVLYKMSKDRPQATLERVWFLSGSVMM